MIEEKQIMGGTNYGCVQLNLKKLMDSKNITISEMGHLCDIKYDVVSNYYFDKLKFYNINILAKFCYILNCNIYDLLSYIPNKKRRK